MSYQLNVTVEWYSDWHTQTSEKVVEYQHKCFYGSGICFDAIQEKYDLAGS